MRIQIGPLDVRLGKGATIPDVTYPPAGKITSFPSVREPFSGAWQRGIALPVEDALAHPTFWACVTLLANDVAKCDLELKREDSNGIPQTVDSASFSPVLRKPNYYQTRIQFYASWVYALETRGNFYALKERDARGVVVALYPLDPSRVRVAVSPAGDVYYALAQDVLAGIAQASAVVPAREIIHDRINAIYHPLVGLSPVYAAGHVAFRSQRMIQNSTRLAAQGFQPGGIITSADTISEENAKKFEDLWMAQYAGPENVGRIAVLAGGLKFEKPPVMSAVEAQIIEQLRWDDEKICSTLHVPGFMVGIGAQPALSVEALTQQYYAQGLQTLFEGIELTLEEGLGASDAGFEIEFCLDALQRMDSATKMDITTKGVKGGIYTPNEGRARHSLPPLTGGDTVYLQEQDHSLESLAKRDAGPDPFGTAKPPAPKPVPAPPEAVPPKGYEAHSVGPVLEAALGALEATV